VHVVLVLRRSLLQTARNITDSLVDAELVLLNGKPVVRDQDAVVLELRLEEACLIRRKN